MSNILRPIYEKTWAQKLNCTEVPRVEIMGKAIWGFTAGTKILISSPREIKEFIESVPKGQFSDAKEMRAQLAKRHGAEVTCRLTTGIFLRIVAEAALDQYSATGMAQNITPFWRVIDDNSKLAKKLSISSGKLKELRETYG